MASHTTRCSNKVARNPHTSLQTTASPEILLQYHEPFDFSALFQEGRCPTMSSASSMPTLPTHIHTNAQFICETAFSTSYLQSADFGSDFLRSRTPYMSSPSSVLHTSDPLIFDPTFASIRPPIPAGNTSSFAPAWPADIGTNTDDPSSSAVDATLGYPVLKMAAPTPVIASTARMSRLISSTSESYALRSSSSSEAFQEETGVPSSGGALEQETGAPSSEDSSSTTYNILPEWFDLKPVPEFTPMVPWRYWRLLNGMQVVLAANAMMPRELVALGRCNRQAYNGDMSVEVC